MAIHMNIGRAKKRLEELVLAALRGEEVIICRNGKPEIRVEPVSVTTPCVGELENKPPD